MVDSRKSQKEQFESNRKKTAIRNMHFNRFLLVRYVGFLFFFINLYGCLLLGLAGSAGILLPAILLLANFASIWEQVKLYSTPSDYIPKTKFYFMAQLLASSMMLIVIFTPLYSVFFTFLNESFNTKLIIFGLTLLACLLSITMLRKIQRIENLEDKQYQRILDLKKALKQ